jgi:hypothetical protein
MCLRSFPQGVGKISRIYLPKLHSLRHRVMSLCYTSGFWPRVRARALRAPVFLDTLSRQLGATRPPPIAASLLHIHRPKNINLLFPDTKASFRPELGPPGSIIFPLDHRVEALKFNIRCPSPHLSHTSKLRCTLLSYTALY